MKLLTKVLAIVCVGLMTATAFQSVSAKGVSHDQWDFVIDTHGWTHGTYVAIDGDGRPGHASLQVFYTDNVGGKWHDPIRISNSSVDTSYPQIDIDHQLGITYITWLEDGSHDRSIWYAGSMDWENWSAPHPSMKIVTANGNPQIDMSAEGGVLNLTWKHHGNAIIITDLDFDMIPDYKDTRPLDFDVDIGVPFTADLVEYSQALGVVVALAFTSGSGSVSISPATPAIPMIPSTHNYFNVTFTGTGTYVAVIKSLYNPNTLPAGILGKHLRMYWLNPEGWRILLAKNENTGVNVNESYVWARLNHLSTFVPGDATQSYSDSDGLTDGKEINIDNIAPQTITTFQGGQTDVSLTFSAPSELTTYIDIPIAANTNPNIDIGWLDVSGTATPFTTPQPIASYAAEPCVWGDKIVWKDYSAGTQNILLRDLKTGITKQLSAVGHPGNDGAPQIWNDWVVWIREIPPPPPYPNHSSYTIVAWNEIANHEFYLGGGNSADIYGTTVVAVTGMGITLYKLNTGDVRYLTVDGFLPRIWSSMLTYIQYQPTNTYDIKWYDLVTDQEHTIATGLTNPRYDFAGTTVAYTDIGSNAGTQIIYKDLVSGESNTISTPVTDIIMSEDGLYWIDDQGQLLRYDFWSHESVTLASGLYASNPSIVQADGDRVVWPSGVPQTVTMVEQAYRQVIELKVGDDPTPIWSTSGKNSFNGKPEISYLMNSYIHSHLTAGMTSISIPLTIKSYSSCTVTLNNLYVHDSPITTSPMTTDADGDGLADGWIDVNGNGIFDAGDIKGEWQMVTNPNSQDFIGTATSRMVAGQVDTFNGNLRITKNLFTVGTDSDKISFDIVYNIQQCTRPSPLGLGWSSPFYAAITEITSDHATFDDGVGGKYIFKVYAGSLYSSPSGFNGKLLAPSLVNPMMLYFPDGKVYKFLPNGKLDRIENEIGRGLSCVYDSSYNLLSIVADGGTTLSFTYNGGQLYKITDEIGRGVKFTFLGTGTSSFLDSLSGSFGDTHFYYIASGFLVKSITPWQLATQYTYTSTSPVKVSQIVQGKYDWGTNTIINPIIVATFSYTYPQSTTDTNAVGKSSSTTFDKVGKVATYTDPSSITTTSTNDYRGNPTAYTDGNGASYQISYDYTGNVIHVQTPDSAMVTNEYYPETINGLERNIIRRQTIENGALNGQWYDMNGNVIRSSNSERIDTLNWYDAYGRVIEQRALDGGRTLRTYDARNNVLSQTDSLCGVTSWTYDLASRRTSETNANGFTHSYTYTATDKISTITDPFGFVDRKWYDFAGNVVWELDKKGFEHIYTYDVFGHKLSEQNPLNGKTIYAYDNQGNLVSTTNPRGFMTSYGYDDSGRQISTSGPYGYTSYYTYDNNGNQISRTDPLVHTWTMNYDTMNRKIIETDPLGNHIHYTYDISGNIIEWKDAKDNIWTYTYDKNNRRTSEADPLGATTLYNYDMRGNLISVTDANGNIWQYQYDQLNRKTAEISPLGNTWTYAYDAVGNQLSRTDPNGATTTYEYCALNRVIKTTYPDGSYITTGYNVCYCNPTSENYYTSTGTLINGYLRTIDGLGRSTSVTTSYGTFIKTVDYTYDTANNVATVTTSDGRATTYTYDGNNRVTSITDPSIGFIEYQYDQTGRTTYRKIGSVGTGYDYNNANRLTEVTTYFGSSTWTNSYTYDVNGRRTIETESNPVWGTETNTYSYDNVGRLTHASYPWGQTEIYTYDPVGNRLTEDTGTQVKHYSYDAENRLSGIDTTQTYIYDSNGNMVSSDNSGQVTSYQYDYENRLVNVNLPSGTSVSYVYLPDGTRIQHSNGVDTNCYLYDREDVINLLDSTSTPIQSYLHGPGTDEPMLLKIETSIYYYAQDGLGSTVALIDAATNSVAAAYRYNAWGNVHDHGGAIAEQNPYLFTGREYDWQTGIYYYRARSYDANLGRFLQRDPSGMVDGTNMYVYCGNDPVNAIDPSGTVWALDQGKFTSCLRQYTSWQGVLLVTFGCIFGDIGTAAVLCLGPTVPSGPVAPGTYAGCIGSGVITTLYICHVLDAAHVAEQVYQIVNCLWQSFSWQSETLREAIYWYNQGVPGYGGGPIGPGLSRTRHTRI